MDAGRKAKLLWKMMKKTSEIILQSGGSIFGGYVRDTILHNHAAKIFYNAVVEGEIELQSIFNYADVDVHPETTDRVLIPHDIDCFFTDADLLKFLASMGSNEFKVKKVFTRDTVTYAGRMPKDFPPGLQHSRYTVHVHIPAILYSNHVIDTSDLPQFTLDVIHGHASQADKLRHFNLDFECNALLMTKDGIFLSPKVAPGSGEDETDPLTMFYRLAHIVDDIKLRRTRVCNPKMEPHRMRHMLQKGWKIQVGESIFTTFNETYTGHCIICHEDVKEDSVKLACCDARYHVKCLCKAAEQGPFAMRQRGMCIACRQATRIVVDDVACLESMLDVL